MARGTGWKEGIIDPSGRDVLRFPTIAYDPLSGEFLVCAMNEIDAFEGEIVLARWNGASFGSWQALHTDDPQGFLPPSVMPRIVAGRFVPSLSIQEMHEFYIVW